MNATETLTQLIETREAIQESDLLSEREAERLASINTAIVRMLTHSVATENFHDA